MWYGVVTNAGKAAIEDYLAYGGTFNINIVKTGTGTVPAANIRAATDLVSQADTGYIAGKKTVSDGTEVQVAVQAATSRYVMKEFGIFATINSTSTVLLAYFNEDGDGVEVPDSSTFPDFNYTVYCLLDCINDEDFTITINPAVYLTASQVANALTVTESGMVLDARQGKVLKDTIDANKAEFNFNPDVMKAAIMAVSGVTHVLIRLNRSSTTVDGIPAGKINVLVSGGAKASICQAIYDTNTSGLETYGTLSAEISGETVYMGRVTLMPVSVRVQLQGLEEPDITDVASDIKSKIFHYINYTLEVGQALEVSRIRDLVNDGLGSITGNIEIMDIYVSGAHGISRGIIPAEWNKKFSMSATTEIELYTTTTATSDAIAKNAATITVLARHTRLTDFSLSDLQSAIADQNLAKYGLRPGDKKTINTYDYFIAGLNVMKGTNSYTCTSNHCGLIVVPHKTWMWNASGSTAKTSDGSNNRGGGYKNCDLHKYLVDTVLPHVQNDLGSNHLYSHKKLLSNAVNTTGYNRFGTNSGCSSGFDWADCYISALTEAQVYGGDHWSSSGYDTGEANTLLPIFADFKHTEIFGEEYVWLRNISSASQACSTSSAGSANGVDGVYGFSYVAGLILYH